MPSHSGIMLRQRGWRGMPGDALANLSSVLGQKQLVCRWWNVNPSEPRDQVNLVAPGVDGAAPKILPMQAILGLSPGESALSPIADVLGKDEFARLESG